MDSEGYNEMTLTPALSKEFPEMNVNDVKSFRGVEPWTCYQQIVITDNSRQSSL